MIGNRGIDQEVQNKVDAYRGNPNALAQKYQQNQQLIDLLALQKLKSEKESAAREMQLKMGGQQMPTIAEARENEVLDLTKQELAQNTSGAMQQQQAQKQQAAKELVDRSAQMPMQSQSPMVQGVAGLPAPNMAAKAMATGGIVAFQAGGEPPAPNDEPPVYADEELRRRIAEGERTAPRAEPREAPSRQSSLVRRGLQTLLGGRTPDEIFKERSELGTTAAGYTPEEKAIIQRQIADRAAYDARMYSPEQQRSEALTRFLLGGAGRTGIGSVLGGAGAAAENYRSAMREGDRERMIERQKQEAGLVDVGPAARMAGLNLGKESERTAMTGLTQGIDAAVRLEQLAQQAALRGNPAEAKKYEAAARSINGDPVIKAWSRALSKLEENNQQSDPQYNDLLNKIGLRTQEFKRFYKIDDPYVPIANPNTTPPAEPRPSISERFQSASNSLRGLVGLRPTPAAAPRAIPFSQMSTPPQ